MSRATHTSQTATSRYPDHPSDIEGGPQLRRLAAIYLNERVGRGALTRDAANNAWYTLADFADSFGRRPLDQLGVAAVERWLASHPEWQPGTRATAFYRARSFCRWMLARGYIHRDPFAGVEPPPRPRPNPRPLSFPEFQQLRAACPDARAKLIVSLMYWLGLRCVEVSLLNVDDIDWRSKTVRVTGKGRRVRELPLVPQIELAINAYLREHPATNGPLIRSYTRPGRLKAATISVNVRHWMLDAGVKHHAFDGRSAHAWRHTALTELAEATRDPYVVQEFAGHSDISTAMHYVRRADMSRLRDGLERRLSAL